jgi:hypothetical protein
MYIERGGEIVFSPPGRARGVRMYSFILRADPKRLGALFDRYLNAPSKGKVAFEPAGSLFVLNFTSLGKVGAMRGPDEELGYFRESEMAIWTLGYDQNRDEIVTFVPYMIVDQGPALAMGREVFGFPKQLGQVEMPGRDEAVDRFSLHLPGLESWGPGQEFTMKKLVEIKSSDPGAGVATESFDSLVELTVRLGEIVLDDPGLLTPGEEDPFESLGKMLEMLATASLPMVFFKQIRDAQEPRRACHQSVQLAEFIVTKFDGAAVMEGKWDIDLVDLANEPIRRELGLPKGTLTPIGAFWVDFDFDLTVTEQLWSADTATITVSVGD